MCEPRGGGCRATRRPRPDADWGVLFIEVTGVRRCAAPASGGDVLVDTGIVAVASRSPRFAWTPRSA